MSSTSRGAGQAPQPGIKLPEEAGTWPGQCSLSGWLLRTVRRPDFPSAFAVCRPGGNVAGTRLSAHVAPLPVQGEDPETSLCGMRGGEEEICKGQNPNPAESSPEKPEEKKRRIREPDDEE